MADQVWLIFTRPYHSNMSSIEILNLTRTTRTPAFWDTPRCPMITHTSNSHQIPSQNKTKSKLNFFRNCQKFKFWNFARNFTSNQNCRPYRADMGCGRDGRRDGGSETNIPPPPPQQLRCAGGIIMSSHPTAWGGFFNKECNEQW